MDELKQLLQKQNEAFEAFKAANNQEIAELKKKGHADPLLREHVDKANAEITRLQKAIDELQQKMNRPGSPSDENEETSRAHRKAFAKWMRKGRQFEGDVADLQTKALQLAVDADGGYAVPQDLDRSIGQRMRDESQILQLVTEIGGSGENYERLFELGDFGAGWVGETDARPETGTPTFGKFTPTYGTLYANPKATQNMLDDAFFDVEGWLSERVGQKFGRDLATAIVSGNGTNRPKGILAYTLSPSGDDARAFGQVQNLTSGTSGSFDADDLISLTHKLAGGYKANARWLLHNDTVEFIRKLKDSDGNYLWRPGLTDGTPSAILGYPWQADPNMPQMAADANAVLFGDFRAYKLIRLFGIRVLRDPFTAKPYVHFYTTQRVGGGLEDTNAIKVLTLSA